MAIIQLVVPPSYIIPILFLCFAVTGCLTRKESVFMISSITATLFIYISVNFVGSMLIKYMDEWNRVREAAILESEEPRQIMPHQREHVEYNRQHQHTRLQRNHNDYAKRSIVRKALRVLPPAKSFVVGDKSNGCCVMLECAICMEVFKDGELIQPLGLCPHQFHSSCLYSWLHSGKSTCPLCRLDLATI